MRQSECVPEHDVGVFDVFVRVGGNPFREAEGGGAGGLGDVAAGGVELIVLVCGLRGKGLAGEEVIGEEERNAHIWLRGWRVWRIPLFSRRDRPLLGEGQGLRG